jgi:hypothetical protein
MWPVMAGQILRIKASARGNHPGAIPVGPGGGIVGRAGIEERHLPTGWMDTACDRPEYRAARREADAVLLGSHPPTSIGTCAAE